MTWTTTALSAGHQGLTDLVGARVLVTGGTQGIGAAIARQFVEAGARVIVAARRPADDGASGQFVAADLTTPDGAAAVADEVLRLLGGVDVLVNNAGSQSYVPGGVMANGGAGADQGRGGGSGEDAQLSLTSSRSPLRKMTLTMGLLAMIMMVINWTWSMVVWLLVSAVVTAPITAAGVTSCSEN